MPRWHLLFDQRPGGAAENMAADEWLLASCHRQPRGFLRLYSWAKPSFSFGVSQKSGRVIHRDFILRHGGEYVRRITGGKTVLHHDELTYAVASSEDLFFREHDLYQSYLIISQVLVRALRRLGIAAELSRGSTPEMSRSNHPCFSFPTPNEIEVNGRKLVGSAQKRDKNALLQHGSLPYSMDYNLYAGGSQSEAAFIRKSMTTLREVADLDLERVPRAVIEEFQDFIGVPLEPFDRGEMERDPHYRELLEKYASDDWNLGR